MNLTSLETDIGGKKTIVYLVFLITGGFITRYIFTPYEIPLVLDSLQYFWYGIELSILNEFPSNYANFLARYLKSSDNFHKNPAVHTLNKFRKNNFA